MILSNDKIFIDNDKISTDNNDTINIIEGLAKKNHLSFVCKNAKKIGNFVTIKNKYMRDSPSLLGRAISPKNRAAGRARISESVRVRVKSRVRGGRDGSTRPIR